MELGIVPGRFEGFMGFSGMETFYRDRILKLAGSLFVENSIYAAVYFDPLEL